MRNGSDDEDQKTGNRRVRAVERAVSILRSFTLAEPRQSVAVIAGRTGLDKATTARLLATLVDCGLVVHDRDGRSFSLGHGVAQLARAMPQSLDIHACAEPVLSDLSRRTTCIAFLSTFAEDGAVCLARAMIDPPVRVQLWSVGERRPYNQGAGPRLLFAHLPRDRQEAFLATPFDCPTPETIADPESLRADARRLRAGDVAVAFDDIVVGLSGAAHLVRNAEGRVIAALSVSGLTPLFREQYATSIAAVLKASAAEFERCLVQHGITSLGPA